MAAGDSARLDAAMGSGVTMWGSAVKESARRTVRAGSAGLMAAAESARLDAAVSSLAIILAAARSRLDPNVRDQHETPWSPRRHRRAGVLGAGLDIRTSSLPIRIA